MSKDTWLAPWKLFVHEVPRGTALMGPNSRAGAHEIDRSPGQLDAFTTSRDMRTRRGKTRGRYGDADRAAREEKGEEEKDKTLWRRETVGKMKERGVALVVGSESPVLSHH